jgi:hypothetical protein
MPHNNTRQSEELDTAFGRTDELSDSDSLFSTGNHHYYEGDDQTLLPSRRSTDSATSVFSFESIAMIPLSQTQARGPELQKKVSFWNGLGLVVGMMIGSGLFSSPGKMTVF